MKRAFLMAICGCALWGCLNGEERSLVGLGLAGDSESLFKLFQEDEILSFSNDEMVARHDLWVYLAARRGCFPAAVRLEQRTFGLVKHHLSPKEKFCRQLSHIHPSEREKAEGLCEFILYLQSVIGGDRAKVEEMKKQLDRLGICSLSQCEEDFLSSGDKKPLMPYAQGVVNIWSDENPPTGDMDRMAFQIPSCVYVPWCVGNANSSTPLSLDIEFFVSCEEKGLNQKQALTAERKGRLLLVLQPNKGNHADKVRIDVQGLQRAMERVFNRYGIRIGSDVLVFGKKVEARSAREIAEIAREIADKDVKFADECPQ